MADLMQQAREQFEAWATSYGYCFTRLAPYDYHDGEARAAWAAWQAALRAAPEGFVLVPIAEVASALDVVRDAMECAYHNRFPECCGQYSPSGCCGNPREAWSKEDQSIMDALHPAEQALAAMLASRPQGVKDV